MVWLKIEKKEKKEKLFKVLVHPRRMVTGGNGEGETPPSRAARPRSDIRPRASSESVFNGGNTVGYSPGPMTLFSSLFGDGDEYKSFTEFLAGAMVDPTPLPSFPEPPSQVTHLICYICSNCTLMLSNWTCYIYVILDFFYVINFYF